MSEGYKDVIVNEFTELAARAFREQVIARAMLDPNAPITIYIDSYGGYLDSLNNMLETLEQVPNPIVTICQGKAMSCGAALLAAGDYRFCGRRSRVMVHQGSSGAGGPIESLQNDVNESKRLNRQLMSDLAKRCGMTVKMFKEEMTKKLVKNDDEARDMYLCAEAALELGIVDFIGMPHIKPHTQYEIIVASEREYEVINKPKKKITKKKTKKKVAKKKTRRK